MNYLSTLRAFFAIISGTLLMISCGGKGDEPEPVTKDTLTLTSESRINISYDQTQSTISFSANTQWSAQVESTTVDWLSITPTSGSAGSGTINIVTQPNNGEQQRTGQIILKAGTASATITVIQQAKVYELSVSPESIDEIKYQGGTMTLAITANDQWTLDIKEYEWLTASAYSGNKGTSSITITVTENSNYTPREAIIRIATGNITKDIAIKQQAYMDELQVIIKDDFEFPSEGGSVTLEIISNTDWGLEIADNDWLIPSNTTGTKGITTLTFTATENKLFSPREVKVKFSAGRASHEILLKQQQVNQLEAEKSEFKVDHNAGQINIDLKANVDYSIEFSCSWAKIIKHDNATLTIEYEENLTTETRSAFLILHYENLTAKVTLIQSASFNSEGGIGDMPVIPLTIKQ